MVTCRIQTVAGPHLIDQHAGLQAALPRLRLRRRAAGLQHTDCHARCSEGAHCLASQVLQGMQEADDHSGDATPGQRADRGHVCMAVARLQIEVGGAPLRSCARAPHSLELSWRCALRGKVSSAHTAQATSKLCGDTAL